MRDIITPPIKGILLNDNVREAGSFIDEKTGREKTYERAYFITVLPLGASNAKDVMKVQVEERLEQSVQKQLSDVAWGSLVLIRVSNYRMTDIQVLSEPLVDFEA